MKTYTRFGAAASIFAVAAGTASPAFAAGTPAGSTITNNVSVAYQVGGVSQTGLSASNSFTVDRKVNFTVAEDGSSTTQVSPGQLAAVTSFIVTNTSNAPLDFSLAASNRVGGTAEHGGTDIFDVSNLRLYADTNNNGAYDSGTDVLITYLDQIAADASSRVFVVADVPLGRSTNDVAGVRLTGTAHEATAASSLGAVVTQTAGANTAGVDTVFADTSAGGNTARDGIHFDEDDYTIFAAALTATKTSRVISDPLNGATNPKLIPGAVVEYCITVANGSGGAAAANVAISDTLPVTTTYDASFGVKVNGTVTSGTCNADGVIVGAHASGVVSGSIPSIAAGDTRTVLFRVTIN
ncbi:MAG TPA: hypothetical protein VGO55_12610 [Allosphingosinicella sp.]|jgi:uncharacterized repeat protein (TIGR01451 family)|nr:hypothetical protein [Allosphingosinicella sp.]